MTELPELPYVWRRVLDEFVAGLLDAEDVWLAVDDFAAGRLPEPARLPVHQPDLAGADEAALVREQAIRLAELLRGFLGGTVPADDLAAEALDVLGLADDADDADAADADGTPGG